MIEKISMKLFGDITSPYLDYFESLNQGIKKADMKYTLHEYICNTIFYSMLVFIIAVNIAIVVTRIAY